MVTNPDMIMVEGKISFTSNGESMPELMSLPTSTRAEQSSQVPKCLLSEWYYTCYTRQCHDSRQWYVEYVRVEALNTSGLRCT